MLEELTAWHVAFVKQNCADTGLGGEGGGGKSRGAAADDGKLGLLRLQGGGQGGEVRQLGIGYVRSGRAPFHDHAIADGCHAGPLAAAAIYRDKAIMAGAHAAKQPAWRAGFCRGETNLPEPRERGSDR